MNYPFAFQVALDLHQDAEGKYAKHPKDPGAETYRGIARAFHPSWPGWKRIDYWKTQPDFPANLEGDSLLQNQVRDFFYEEFWKPLRMGEIGSGAVVNELFDIAAGPQGSGAAARITQGALILLNRPVLLDGDIGPKTIAAINAYPYPHDLAKMMDRLAFVWALLGFANFDEVLEMVRSRLPQLQAFMRGWLKRSNV